MKISISGDTDVGRHREHNEDSHIVLYDNGQEWLEINNTEVDISGSKGLIFAVADGMGGTNAGEIASALTVDALKEKVREIKAIPENQDQANKILNSMILFAHNKIVREAKSNKETKGMGTTIVLGWIVNNILYIAWSGDSRCYHYKRGRVASLIPFTDDHSLVWSRVKLGEITPEQARLSDDSNLILQALGDTLQSPKPDFRWTTIEKNDRILICSDGLNSMLSDIGMQQILDFGSDPTDTCQSLIKAANNAGGRDNITVILADVLEESEILSQPAITTRSAGKRWQLISIIILLLAIICAGIISLDRRYHYLKDLKVKFQKIINDKPDNRANPDKEIKTTKTISESHTNQKQSNFENINKSEEIALVEKIPLDTFEIIVTLKKIESQIEDIEKNMKDWEPGGAERDNVFYTNNVDSFLSIHNHLKRIRISIQQKAVIRKDITSSYLIDNAWISDKFLDSLESAVQREGQRFQNLIVSTKETSISPK